MKPRDPIETRFINLLAVNSQVRTEAQEVMRSKTSLEIGEDECLINCIDSVVEYDCDAFHGPHTLRRCLNSLTISTRTAIKSLRIWTGHSEIVEYSWKGGKLRAVWSSYANPNHSQRATSPNYNWPCDCGGNLWDNIASMQG